MQSVSMVSHVWHGPSTVRVKLILERHDTIVSLIIKISLQFFNSLASLESRVVLSDLQSHAEEVGWQRMECNTSSLNSIVTDDTSKSFRQIFTL